MWVDKWPDSSAIVVCVGNRKKVLVFPVLLSSLTIKVTAFDIRGTQRDPFSNCMLS